MHLSALAEPTCLPKIEVLLIARGTVDHMLPLLVLLDILMPSGPRRKILQNIGFGAPVPFWVGVRSLHSLLVFTLQAIPLLFRCFAVHVRQSLWHMSSRMQGLLSRFLREVLPDPSPESFLHSLGLGVMELCGDFLPGVPLTPHLEDPTNLVAMVALDSAFDQFDQ